MPTGTTVDNKNVRTFLSSITCWVTWGPPMSARSISDLFPTDLAALPEPRGMTEEFEDVAPGELTGFMGELYDQMMRQGEVLVEAFAALEVAYKKNPDAMIEQWRTDSSLSKLLSVIVELPPEAASGPFKITGMVPKAFNADAAARFGALTVLYSARAIFFAERRGIDGFLSGVHSRSEKYKPYLEKNEQLVIEGFPTLRSVIETPSILNAIHKFASGAWSAFSGDTRALMCLGTSHDLLLAWGRGGEKRSPTGSDVAATLREIRELRGE
jgi:hypothetical protein